MNKKGIRVYKGLRQDRDKREVNFGAANVSIVEKKRKEEVGIINPILQRIQIALRLFNKDFVATMGEMKRDITAMFYTEGNKAIIDIPVFPNKFDNHLEYHRVVLWDIDELEGGKIEHYIRTAKNWKPSDHAVATRQYNNMTVYLIIGKQLGKIPTGLWRKEIGKKHGVVLFYRHTKKAGFTDGRYLARKILESLADFFEMRLNRLAEIMEEKKKHLFDKMGVINNFLRRAIELFRDAKKAAALIYMWDEKVEAEYKRAERYLDFFTKAEKKVSEEVKKKPILAT